VQELIKDIKSSPITVIGYQAASERHLESFLPIFSDYHRIEFVDDISKLNIGDFKKVIMDVSTINIRPRSNIFEFKTDFINFIKSFPRDRNLIITKMSYATIDGAVSRVESEILYRADVKIFFQKDQISILKNRINGFNPNGFNPSRKYRYSELRDIKIDNILKS
jgi:hypothetical protein